jgi:TRAP-type uncharacterized transport system substrate-binding protein
MIWSIIMTLKQIFTATVLTLSALAFTHPTLASDRSYILATASTGGTYYPVGVALATLSKV